MENFDYKEYAAQRKAKAQNQAREYFYHQKERKPYYWAEGSTLDDTCSHNEAFFHFTDEEVARIKQLIIDTVNADQPEAEHVSTVKEAIDCLTYNEIFEQSEELRTLLGQRCEEADLDPDTIDFDTPFYFYKFSVLAFNYDDNKVCGPIPVEAILSDDDYLTLLTLQLLDRDSFSFNRLLTTHPELAAKLNSLVNCYQVPFNAPYTILFDELRADAEAIDGPLGATEEIYSDMTSEEIHHIYASAYSRILTVGEETMKDDALFAVQHQLEQINADAVMAALSAHDYRDMIQKLKEKFPTHSAFADIKAWLTATGIPFKETESK
jgi:hypothetical protein